MKRFALFLFSVLFLFSCAHGEETLTLSFIGDCSMGEMYQRQGADGNYTDVLDEKGFDWPFSLVRDLLEADDFTFANNELTYTRRTKRQDKPFNLVAAPEYAQAYLYSGIDALNTINNHCVDFFLEGYDDTLHTLDQLGIPHFGTLYPGTQLERDILGVYEVKGVKIGAVGISYPQDADLGKLRRRIQILRNDEQCDLVIVSLHWGREEQFTPQNWQFSYARKLIDMGADVIWGHHPHVLQCVQFYKGKPIFYSTGNFTFGSMKEVDRNTGIFQLTYTLKENDQPDLYSFSVIPCTTQGKGDYRPMPLTDEEAQENMLRRLIYKGEKKNMVNLPEAFVHTGIVYLLGEELSLQSPK